MAFKLAEIFTELTVRGARQFSSQIDNTRGLLNKTVISANAVKWAAAGMFAAAGAAAVKSLKRFAEAEEIMSQFEAVFKEGTYEADRFAKALSGRVGRSVVDVRSAMAGFQDTFVPLGFARDKARLLSQQLTQLGIDLSSFKNIGMEETFQLMQSALVGNHEAVRRFGIVITESSLKQKLAQMQSEGLISTIDNQAKVMARLQIIMESTKDAQGDAERTAGSLTNQYRAMAAQVDELSIIFGKSLAPAAKRALAAITESAKFGILKNTIDGLVATVETLSGRHGGLIESGKTVGKGLLSDAGMALARFQGIGIEGEGRPVGQGRNSSDKLVAAIVKGLQAQSSTLKTIAGNTGKAAITE
jgi:hypothetical protein